MARPEMEDIIHKFESFTEKPVNYLTIQTGLKDDIKNFVKTLYDYTKSEESKGKKSKKSALPKLIVQDFDEEQIWQQIEIQNSDCWDQFVWEVANCLSSKNDLVFPVETSKHPAEAMEKDIIMSEEDDHSSDEDVQSSGDNDTLNTTDTVKKMKPRKGVLKKVKPSIVDDKFFKLQEMEHFLINEEKKEEKQEKPAPGSDSDNESIDLFNDIEDDDDTGEEKGVNEMMYSDFFDQGDNEEAEYEKGDDVDEYINNEDNVNESESETHHQKSEVNKTKQKGKKVKFADESSDYDDSDEESINFNEKISKDEKKSDFEERQQRLQQQISRLENRTLKEAPWQLKGEVDATKRPQNSLLEEVVDFDLTSRPAPIITEQTTITLEDIITQRIKDKAWDDVIRKEKPVDDQLSFRKPEILDQSKSKLSLAQVYEAEYLKQKQALSGEVEEEKEPESHVEIREAMSKLFLKLDALCNYHYTPKVPHAEVKIVSNTPAISMEEVAPVATSDAALLAPEEIKKKRRGELMSKEERTQTDKKRERRKKKKLQKGKEKVEKVTDNRNTKKANEASDKSLKTSKAFFQQLNDNSTSLIKTKNKRNVKNKGQ
ncbi:unnamed protein product [Diatraea saccharalis]|uniref:U3 small nucleolar ribonucleoprotein protein MPP10 n=1 Tax=Diatraea saccharalis TaxID=40085 RepID=A0A9N9RG77_9NEOP|nr:unnamed protein product [Diatraea saccharalis]